MNDFLLSVLLGIVEGLTEFLPVSSTGHLRIVEALFHLNLHDSFWKMYTIVIQLGAILALPVYFWNRILKFLGTFPRGERGDRNLLTHPLSLTMIAFVVTALPAWALHKKIGENLEKLWVIATRTADRRSGDVDCGRGLHASPGHAHGRNEFASGDLDRRMPDSFGGVSGNFAVNVDHRGGTNRESFARGGA